MKRITAAALSVALAAGAAACSDRDPSGPDVKPSGPDTTSLTPPSGMVVSNALASSGSASSVAYVSAAPGTFPDAASAAIRNQTRNGASQSVQVIDGGFDPVGISADVGDELSMAVSVTGSGSTSIVVKVPPRHPPEVVRTNPRNGRDDVALNVHLVVVFSEPVDKSSLDSSNIALVQDETNTTGSLQVADDGLSAEFIPTTLLLPETTYALVFWRVHDLDGDPLGYNRSVTFTTAVAARVGTIVVTSATTGTTGRGSRLVTRG